MEKFQVAWMPDVAPGNREPSAVRCWKDADGVWVHEHPTDPRGAPVPACGSLYATQEDANQAAVLRWGTRVRRWRVRGTPVPVVHV